ncbi:hypothetical protein LJC61_06800 [Ruminococcaceae bacterium OttesenSCG-928-A16]|nr:hypothetical protein [Ruminococcaceae bacterium OttesenSCG-928-A16]
MGMQTAAIIAVLAGLITTALMVVLCQFVTPEEPQQPEINDQTEKA